jgi:hypothetical protein
MRQVCGIYDGSRNTTLEELLVGSRTQALAITASHDGIQVNVGFET